MLSRSTTAILAAICLATITAACARAENLTGIVTRVWDGDTVTLTVDGQEHRVRLAGIDAPEHDQPYGAAARQRLSHLVRNRPARLETEKRDQHGRLVGRLWVQPEDCPSCGRTLDAGLALLTVGLAWWYEYYADEQAPDVRGQYEFAAVEARAKRAGLWQDEQPIAPWDWRRNRDEPAPGDCRIKGNISANGRIYHLPGQQHYDRTRISLSKGERWFCSEAEAQAAGWRRAAA